MQNPTLQFQTEEDLQKFLKEAQEKKDEGDVKEERHVSYDTKRFTPPLSGKSAYSYSGEKKAGGMNNKYHYYRMIVFMVAGVLLIAIGDKIVTAIGVGLVALAIILHQATMSIVIREELK
jgi:hypothetical protein